MGFSAGQLASASLISQIGGGVPSLYAQGASIMGEKVDADTAPQWKKDLAILGGAGVTAVTEKYALDKVLGPLAKPLKNAIGSGLARIGIAAAAEGGQEIAENLLHDALRIGLTNPEAEFDLRGTAYEGGVGAAVGGIVRTAVETALGIRNRAARAQQSAESLGQLFELAKASKVLQRSPETFEGFIADVSRDFPVDQVYIDANEFLQMPVSPAIIEASPAVATQIEQAAGTGGAVSIPVEELLSRIAPVEGSEALIDHLRTEADGMSRAEAVEFFQSPEGSKLREELERAVSRQVNPDAFTAQVDAIGAEIAAELDQTGRFTKEANRAYSSLVSAWYGVTAERLGITPTTLRERFRLNVVTDQARGEFEQALASQPPKGWRHATTGEDAAALYEGRDTGEAVFFTDLQGKLAQDAPELAGFSHSINRQAADHIRKNHGDAKAEALRGQAAITGKDIARIPEIVTQYDGMRIVTDWKGDTLIAYAKRFDDGVTVYLEGMTRRRSNLRGVSMRRYLTSSDADTILDRAVRDEINVQNERSIPAHEQSLDDTGDEFNQPSLGGFSPETNTIRLSDNANLSTFLHESGHFFLHAQGALASELRARDPATLNEGERQMIADMDAVLEWYGVRDQQTWDSMSMDEQRPYHEQFARGFEKYLFSGQAPSLKMQSLFQRFASWLRSIYRKIAAFDDVKLTPEVRGVMDRMLASDAEIERARQARSMFPLFESEAAARAAGVTPEELEAFWQDGREQIADAQQELQAKSLRDMQWLQAARGREISRLKREHRAQRAEVRAEVEAQVMAQPIYRAWRFLRDGEMEQDGETIKATDGHRLNMDMLREMYPAGELAGIDIAPLVRRKLAGKDGMPPDVAADIFGFSSGDELVRTLLSTDPPKTVIDAMTDQRMLERHGELATPEAIERAADAAIHNAARIRFATREANALARAVGKPRLLIEAVREFAARAIGGVQIRALSPNQYARAETRAARAAEQARKKGDMAAAAQEKRNEALNAQLAREAYRAQDEVRIGLAYLRRFNGDKAGKRIGADYLDQIHGLLERFDLRAISNRQAARRESLAAWVEKQRSEGIEPDLPEHIANEAVRVPYKNLSVEDFRGLVDSVRQVAHLGQLKNRLLTAKKNREFAAARDEIVASIVENSRGEREPQRSAANRSERMRHFVKGFLAAHIKAASLARVMDGGRDGGVFWEYFIRPANAAGDTETGIRQVAGIVDQFRRATHRTFHGHNSLKDTISASSMTVSFRYTSCHTV
ncbi:MAG: hypothetical protein LBI92_06200 [Azoarcus sp.]|jgi:hypothetical protein|nr:hypothetical protein [Azoarcus sp.]